MHNVLLLMSTAIAAVTGADDAPKTRSVDTQAADTQPADTGPTDVERSHVEEITAGQHKYTVIQSGTMDGRSCRSPMG